MDLAGFRFQDPLVAVGRARRRRSSSSPRGCARADALARASRSPAPRASPRAARAGACACATCRRSWPRSALVAGAVALARPQHGTLRENVTTQGVDIVVALDVSGSMAAEDFQPRNRLEVAKDVVAEFVRRRTADRVGLVVFAGRSLTKSPPTTDTAVLLRQLDDVRLDMLPDGTAIGSGLATSLTRLRRSQAKSKVIVLVTDGANNAGEIDPATAADMAKAMDVRVYTILVGRGGRVPMPVKVQNPFTGEVGQPDRDDRGADRRGPAAADRRAHRRRVLPRHRPGVAAHDLRAHRPAREVGDPHDRVPALPRAVPARARGSRPRCSPPRPCAWAAGLRVVPA